MTDNNGAHTQYTPHPDDKHFVSRTLWNIDATFKRNAALAENEADRCRILRDKQGEEDAYTRCDMLREWSVAIRAAIAALEQPPTTR